MISGCYHIIISNASDDDTMFTLPGDKPAYVILTLLDFYTMVEHFAIREEGNGAKHKCELWAQVLRGTASNIRPLALSLRE